MTTQSNDLFDSGDQPKDTSLEGKAPADMLAALVGEGKPFKTVEDLAKSKIEADRFIDTLKGENAGMRKMLEQASTSTKTNELLQNLMAKLEQASNDGSGDGNQPGDKTLTREDIVNMVRGQVAEEHMQAQRLSNRMKANAEVAKHFSGDEAKAKAFVTAKGKELGLSGKDLQRMAEETPLALLAVLGVGQRTTPSGSSPLPPGGGSNPPANGGEDTTVRNYAYYKELRKKLGHRYYQPHIQQQLIKDRKALGDNFFDKPN